MNRTTLLLALASFLALRPACSGAEPPAALALDHIGLGCADLDSGIAFVAEKTGVHPIIGGIHPKRGTRNALMALGGGTYLEVIAPVKGAKLSADDAGLLKLATPEPIFYALRSTDLDATAKRLSAAGIPASAIAPGTRKTPQGSELKWRTFSPTGEGLDAAPFFIEWDRGSPHPSSTSPGGCSITIFEVFDKDTVALAKLFSALDIRIPIRIGAEPALRLTLTCPKGEVVFGP